MAGETIESVFRDFQTAGVPSSGKHEPVKSEIRNLLTALVFGEGAGGAVVHLNNANEGTGNAIEVTTAEPLPDAAWNTLYLLNITAANTGPVTISVNGAPAVHLHANNEELAAGDIQPGDVLLVADAGNEFRTITAVTNLRNKDAAVAAQAAAELAQQLAEDARDIAAGYASDAVSQGNVPIYATIAGMGAISVPVGINAIRVNGNTVAGDGYGGLYIDSDNGSADTFTSGDGRTWYQAPNDLRALSNKTLAKINLGLPASPFEGTAQVMRQPPLGNISFCVGLAEEYSTGLSILWRFDVCAVGHVTIESGVLMAAYSRDGGITWKGYRTIYSDGVATVAGGTRIGNMGGGRVGGIMVLREGGINVPYFIYSDDYFATPPTVVDISASITETNPFAYYKGIPWPAADGGDDVNGFIWPIYGSAQDRALVIGTDDNGATFSEIEVNGPTPNGRVSEIVPLRLPDGSWMVFARSDNENATPVYCCVASTFAGLSGSTWVDTGVVCGNNPFSAIVDDEGVVHLSIIYRTLAGADYSGQRDIQIIHSQKYQTLYAAGGAFSGEGRFGHQFPSRATGMPVPFKIDGRWLTYVTVGESRLSTGLPSRTQAVLISSEPRASMPAGFSTAPLPAENLLFNPYFEATSGPLSGTAVATNTETADCNFTVSSGDTMDFSIEATPAAIRDRTPFRPLRALRLTVAAQDGSCGFINKIEGKEGQALIGKLSAQPHCALGIIGYDDVVPNLQASVSVDAEGDASSLAIFSETFPAPQSSNGGIWYTECEVGISGADTGISPIDEVLAADAKVQVGFQTSGGSTGAFDTAILGVSMSFNDSPSWPVQQRMPQDYRERTQVLALVNGPNNDVFIDAGYARVSGPDAAYSITGFTAPPHINEFTLHSPAALALTIANANAGSEAKSRIATNGSDVTSTNLCAFRFRRDRQAANYGWVLCGKEL